MRNPGPAGLRATEYGIPIAGGAGAAVPVVAKVFVDPVKRADASPAIPIHGVAALALAILNPNPDAITGSALPTPFRRG